MAASAWNGRRSLAAFVLAGQPGWTAEPIAAAMAGDRTIRVSVSPPIPVFVFYTTAIVRVDETVEFFDRRVRPGLPAGERARRARAGRRRSRWRQEVTRDPDTSHRVSRGLLGVLAGAPSNAPPSWPAGTRPSWWPYTPPFCVPVSFPLTQGVSQATLEPFDVEAMAGELRAFTAEVAATCPRLQVMVRPGAAAPVILDLARGLEVYCSSLGPTAARDSESSCSAPSRRTSCARRPAPS